MNKFAKLSLSALSLGVTSWAHASILPPNNLHLEDNINFIANMTEEEFKAIIDGVVKHYEAPAAEQKA